MTEPLIPNTLNTLTVSAFSRISIGIVFVEAIDAAEDDPPGEEPPAGDGEKDPPAAQEDEEVGSFTLGKCR